MAQTSLGGFANKTSASIQQKSQPVAFLGMMGVFFLCGFLTALNELWVPYLKDLFDLSHTTASLVPVSFFIAFFIVSPIAGKVIDRVGYQRGIVFGLLITAVGCLLVFPAVSKYIYGLYLLAFFVVASGIAMLQVAANPYVAALGPEKTSPSRLNFAQSTNSLGTIIGPWVGAIFILGTVVTGATETNTSIVRFYSALACVLFCSAIIFAYLIKLPSIESVKTSPFDNEIVWNNRPLILGVLAIFLYVGAEVSVGTWLIVYFKSSFALQSGVITVGKIITFYWLGAFIGRLIGALLMNFIAAPKYLFINALMAITTIMISINSSGNIAMVSILAVGFFNSVMFPTIFAIALKGLGPMTNRGSGLLCQAIVGGAFIPVIQGTAADNFGIQLSFIVPMLCYLFVVWYALKGANQSA